MDNNKHIVLITGVTRGLGLALTEKLMSLGHTVLGCGRSARIIEQLRAQNAKRHDFDVVDVAVASQVNRWAERLHIRYGAPTILINNAGIINRNAPLNRGASRKQIPISYYDDKAYWNHPPPIDVPISLPRTNPAEVIRFGKPQSRPTPPQGLPHFKRPGEK